MTSTIRIDSIKPTAKSLVIKSGATEYFAKKDSGLDNKVGSTIEAETKQSNYNGKDYVWIEKWKMASSAPQQDSNSQNSRNAPVQQGAFTATGVNLAFLPFVSNCVAHAIQCGQITEPSQISRWANAAYDAASSLKVDDFQ